MARPFLPVLAGFFILGVSACDIEGPDTRPYAPPASVRKPVKAEGHGSIEAKMREIIIPLVDFEDTSLEEAVDFLRLRSVDLDPDRSMPGVGPIVIRKPSHEADPGARRVKKLQMKNVSLWDALQRVARETGTKVEITDRAIELRAR